MAAYLQNRLPHKYLPSSTIPCEFSRAKDQQYHTFSHSEVNDIYIYLRGRYSSGSKHLPHVREAIIVAIPFLLRLSSVHLRGRICFYNLGLGFPKKTSSSVPTTLRRIVQGPEPDPGSTP
jgi:hypothetical protein